MKNVSTKFAPYATTLISVGDLHASLDVANLQSFVCSVSSFLCLLPNK